MKFAKFLVPALALSVAACGGDADDDEVVVASTDSIAMEPAHMPEEGMDQPPGGMGETAQFAALGDSGVSGEVTFGDRGEQTEVLVRLTGAPADGQHNGHIHTGTCDSLGGVVAPLEAVNVDDTGTGSMTTEVELEAAELMNGQHIVVYHAADMSPMTCAAVPQITM